MRRVGKRSNQRRQQSRTEVNIQNRPMQIGAEWNRDKAREENIKHKKKEDRRDKREKRRGKRTRRQVKRNTIRDK